MTKNIFILASLGLTLSACSGGSGGSSSPLVASYVAAPSASCKGSPCVPGANISSSPVHTRATAARAVTVYETFNTSFIKQFNIVMSKVHAGLVSGGSQSCSDVSIGESGTSGGYDYSVTSPNKSIPTGFTQAGMAFNYRIYAAIGESPIAEVQVYCGQDTESDPRTIYGRVNENGAKFEFVFEKANNKIKLMGSGILANGDRMIAWFKTDDGDKFDFVAKSNINSVSDYYLVQGIQTANTYNISNATDMTQICVNSMGSTTSCGATVQPTPATLAVTNSTDWNTVNVGSFSIVDP